MIIFGTKNILISDNSGIVNVKCIKILGSSFCNSSNIGDTVVVAIQSAKVKKKVSRGEVYKSILAIKFKVGWFPDITTSCKLKKSFSKTI